MSSVFDIAVLGTSLTTGAFSRGWPEYLQRALQVGKSQKVRAHALGKEGATSSWGLANIAPLIRLRPRVAIIEFINDAYAPYQSAAPENMTLVLSASNFSAIIAGLRAGTPDTQIFLMKFVRPRADSATNLYPLLSSYDYQVTSISASSGLPLIDVRSAWGDPALHPEDFIGADGTHCAISGHLRVSIPTIVAAVAPLIN